MGAGGQLSVSLREENRSAVISIRDEGEGIPAADLERIFDKFHRAQKSDHVRAGTGLGLAISRGFVEAMRGTITAANRSDRTGAALTSDGLRDGSGAALSASAIKDGMAHDGARLVVSFDDALASTDALDVISVCGDGWGTIVDAFGRSPRKRVIFPP